MQNREIRYPPFSALTVCKILKYYICLIQILIWFQLLYHNLKLICTNFQVVNEILTDIEDDSTSKFRPRNSGESDDHDEINFSQNFVPSTRSDFSFCVFKRSNHLNQFDFKPHFHPTGFYWSLQHAFYQIGFDRLHDWLGKCST